MGYKVAVVGATGNVGHEMLKILDERNFPADDVVALASSRSAGREVSYGDKDLKVQDLAKFDFKGIDIVLSSPGGKVSAEYSPKAAAAGAIVIDNTSYWRMDPDVPLIVPEVNPEAINDIPKGIIANPNCSTIQMVVALNPYMTLPKSSVLLYQHTSLHLAPVRLQWMSYLTRQKGFMPINRLNHLCTQNRLLLTLFRKLTCLWMMV